ncbi:MAG: YbcC family protein [Marinomonas foliarum]|uniref:YbcC family protein n=1 Tax=Marinomonas foliarum TaxID=491950 RepID=UPI003F9CCFAC
MTSKAPNTLSMQQKDLLLDATNTIAPHWPLDKLIAVNPLWALVNKPFDDISDELSTLAGIKTHLPIKSYRAWYDEGRISQDCLTRAAREYEVNIAPESLLEHLSNPNKQPSPWRNIADLADQQRSAHKMSWHDEITHQVSQFCAAHYQQQSPTLRQQNIDSELDLYSHWLEVTNEDKGLSIIMAESKLTDFFHNLPSDKDALFALAIDELALDDQALRFYAQALLLDINGWSSYLAYLNWSKGDNNENLAKENHVESLLAIKVAWELVIWRYLKHTSIALHAAIETKWSAQKSAIPLLIQAHQDALLTPKIWALALEYSEQKNLHKTLTAEQPVPAHSTRPELQAIFCIDVRSEVFRRALEKQSDTIQTLGFAGFFGLPIEYKAKDSHYERPQLPGLLQASITATECKSDKNHVHHQQKEARWHRWGHAAPASFSMVESMGWWYAFKMLKQTLFSKRQVHPANRLAPNTHWQLTQQGVALTDQDKANLAKGILDTIKLPTYAPIVMLIGHGSHTSNNLHAAGLECGACGGQSGEVNVRVLASLLNDDKVRALLNNMDAAIPSDTQFVPALHNTTTDQLTCFDQIEGLKDTDSKMANWLKETGWFEKAQYLAQQERAAKLDTSLLNASDKQLSKAFTKRANDWSQVNPEWGLANNHSFIIAPRQKTRQLDLQGRSFLHDYDPQNDPDFAILERILTAPMLVTHWINMQYNLSVTDNFKFGCGNKVLHNAVGGNIGVFEGNGGDLRIGLSMQSLSNGEKWMHTPVRLAVYIAAPKAEIEKIAAKHDIVRQLIDNGWLYLFQWEGDKIQRFYQQQWQAQG